MSKQTKAINQPCETGRELGRNLARFADVAEQEWRDSGISFVPQRCHSCAFKAGTYPNGCISTVADAMKCMMEREPFYCHHGIKDGEPSAVCGGWLLLQNGDPPVQVPWKFSGDYTEPNP